MSKTKWRKVSFFEHFFWFIPRVVYFIFGVDHPARYLSGLSEAGAAGMIKRGLLVMFPVAMSGLIYAAVTVGKVSQGWTLGMSLYGILSGYLLLIGHGVLLKKRPYLVRCDIDKVERLIVLVCGLLSVVFYALVYYGNIAFELVPIGFAITTVGAGIITVRQMILQY